MVTEERGTEVRDLLERVREWANGRPDVLAVALAGSWVKGSPTMDSDVDLIVLTTAKQDYLEDESWIGQFGGLRIVRTQDWGLLYTERRFVLPSGLEIEFGVAPTSWAATDPPDPNVSEDVGNGGLRTIYDPESILRRFVEACRRELG